MGAKVAKLDAKLVVLGTKLAVLGAKLAVLGALVRPSSPWNGVLGALAAPRWP